MESKRVAKVARDNAKMRLELAKAWSEICYLDQSDPGYTRDYLESVVDFYEENGDESQAKKLSKILKKCQIYDDSFNSEPWFEALTEFFDSELDHYRTLYRKYDRAAQESELAINGTQLNFAY